VWVGIGAGLALLSGTIAGFVVGEVPGSNALDIPVLLSGLLPHLPTGTTLLGPAPATQDINADVVLNLPDPTAVANAISAVSTPGSPEYRQFLAPGQFASDYGPSASTLSTVRSWLSSEGLQVGPTSDGFVIPVTANVSLLSSVFDTTLQVAHLASGLQGIVNTVAPSLPAFIAQSVDSIVGLDGVVQETDNEVDPRIINTAGESNVTPTPNVQFANGIGPEACSAVTSNTGVGHGAYSASQLANTYNFSGLYSEGRTGAGQSIAVYELESYAPSDIATYDACYGITPSISNVLVDGGPTGPAAGSGESALDIEDAISFAPNANIIVYEGSPTPSNPSAPLDIYKRIASDDLAKVVTTSWGVCEQDNTPSGMAQAEAEVFSQMALQGQTMVAAAGDQGSEDCQGSNALAVDDPGSQPDVTSVGGTSLPTGSTSGETVWNNCLTALHCKVAAAGAGGGGISTVWKMPSWQASAGRGVINAYSNGNREVPDVSADADPFTGVEVFYGGHWVMVGGTSAAAPLWAALFSLANQSCSTPIGFANPALYALGSADSDGFNDITSGNNDFLGDYGGRYPATAGYDMASGWGSPNAANLVAALDPSASCSERPGGGYWLTAADGGIFNYGSAPFYGSIGGHPLNEPVVGIAATPDNHGYWEVAADGGIFSYGDAQFYGSMGGQPLLAPVVGMAVTPDGRGYWLVSADGGIFSFGDARFYGSYGGHLLASPMIGIAAAPNGTGYWMVAKDGGVFGFGSAQYYGSMAGKALSGPIVGMATTYDGSGYWLVGSDGAVYTFGDARYEGSEAGQPIGSIAGIATSPGGGGYWLIGSNGGVFNFGNADFYGSAGTLHLVEPVVGIAGN
jgi:hypothetical protein